jgi:hypothetical protein
MEEDHGEHVGILFGTRVGAEGDPEWAYLPHQRFDGIGGFAHFLRSRGAGQAAVSLPVLREPRAPGFWRKLVALAGFLLRKPKATAVWKLQEPGWSGLGRAPAERVPSVRAVECLSAERTSRVAARAQAAGASLNSWLLHRLARAAQGELAPGPSLWAIPVNMRGAEQGPLDTGNFASYVQLEVTPTDSAAQVHGGIRGALRRLEHWGAWKAIGLGRIVGYGGVRRLYRYDRVVNRAWVGTLSNLGSWNGVGGGEWFFCPPVTCASPLGVGALICDGRLSLTLQAWPGLRVDRAWARALLKRWLEQLESV